MRLGKSTDELRHEDSRPSEEACWKQQEKGLELREISD